MAAAADDDSDILLLTHQLPVDMDGPDEGRLAHLLAPLHRAPPPPPPPPFRPPAPPQAVASAEHRLSFRGWLGAPRHWDLWVAKLRPLHASLWRRLGIHDAVLASTYRIKPDASPVLHLASFWSPATSTFAFPWGEATLTLHDVALIAGLPATGSPVPAPFPPELRPDEAALNGVRLGFNRSACKKAHLSAWIKHFLNDQNDAIVEHAAFLALWLTRFVLPGHPESTMRQAVFSIAVRLARGERIALAPAVLASLYRDLRGIKAFLVAAGAAVTTGNADMLSSLSLYSPLYILHLWMWERFPALRPGRENLLEDGQPMAARWHDLSRKIGPTLIREVLSSRDNFLWQLPYATSLNKYSGWVCSSDLTGNDQLRLLAHSLRPCELVGMDCIEQYLPHRVARQFGMDQDVPMDVRRANQDWVVAWQTYELEGKNVSLFIPQSEPGITARYAKWWRQQLPHSDLHEGAPSILVESKTSKRKVKKTPAAMEAEAEKERRMKKSRVSPSDKKRRLEELYDPKLSGWLAAGRNGISDAAGSSCKRESLPKYDMGSDEALLPNVGVPNDDVVLLVPRMQTASPAVVVPKKDDIMHPAIGDGGNFIVDTPPEISNNKLDGGATAVHKAEKINNPIDRPLDITDKPEEDTAVMKSDKEAMEISVARSLDVTDRPEGASVAIELEKEAAIEEDITHNVPEDETTKVLPLESEKLRDSAPVEEDTKEKPCADGKDLAEKDVDESTDVYKVKQAEGEGCDLLMGKHGDNITDAPEVEQAAEGQARALTEKGIHDRVEEITLVEQVDGQSESPTMMGTKDIPEEITQAHEKESDNDMMKDSKYSTSSEMPCSSDTIQFQRGMMEKQCIQNVEPNNQREPSSDAAALKVEVYDQKTMDMHEEVALAQKHSQKIIGENRATTVLEGCHMLDTGVKSDLITSKVDEIHTAGGLQNQEISDLDKEMALKQKQDNIIIGDNEERMVSEGSHMLDSRVTSDLVTLETDETYAGGGTQNQEIGMDNEMDLKQKQDHIITCDNQETTEPRGINMLDTNVKSNLVTLEVDGTPAAEGNENQEISDFNKQQGMNEIQDLGAAIENSKMNTSEDEDIPVCSGYQIGTAIENNIMNMSEDAGVPHCSDYRTDPTGMEVNEAEFTKRLQNQELLENKEQLAMEKRQHLVTTIENNRMNLPNEAGVLACSEYRINSTGAEVIEVKSTKGVQNQELLDNKDQVREKKMEGGITYGSGTSLEEAYKLGGAGAYEVAVNVSDSTQNKETCTIEEATTEEKQHCEVERVTEQRILEDTIVNVSDLMQNEETCTIEEATTEDKQHRETGHVNEQRILEDTIMIDSGALKSDAADAEVGMAGSKEGTPKQYALSVETEAATQEKQDQEMAGEDAKRDVTDMNALECRVKPDGAVKTSHETLLTTQSVDIAGSKQEAAMQEKQDQEMSGEDTNRDVADMNSLECGVKPDGAVKTSHETLTTQSLDKAGSKLSSENKEKVTPFEEHNVTEVAVLESNQTTGMEPEGALPLEPENLVEVKQENLETETGRSIFMGNDKVPCRGQTSARVMIADQCEDDNGWAEESTKSYDKLASDSILTASHHPVKFGKSSDEEVKRAQNIRSMYLKDIKESLGRIRAEPLDRVQTTNFGYPSRHAAQEAPSSCKEIKVPLRESGRDFGRDRALEFVATSPAEETSRWRQEQYALQILEDVQNARIAEKTRMEMEVRILKAQIASMERQVMNLDHFSEVKSRSKRH